MEAVHCDIACKFIVGRVREIDFIFYVFDFEAFWLFD